MKTDAKSLCIILFRKWKKTGNSLRMTTGKPLTLEESCILESRNNEIAPPLRKPSHMVIGDDCQGTDMYSLARRDLMKHVTIKQRHIRITICYLMQSWSGLPRVIRLNATHFIIYKKIWNNSSRFMRNLRPTSTLMSSWEYTTMQSPNLMVSCSLTQTPRTHMRFRSGFN